jgi:hypothetical protein
LQFNTKNNAYVIKLIKKKFKLSVRNFLNKNYADFNLMYINSKAVYLRQERHKFIEICQMESPSVKKEAFFQPYQTQQYRTCCSIIYVNLLLHTAYLHWCCKNSKCYQFMILFERNHLEDAFNVAPQYFSNYYARRYAGLWWTGSCRLIDFCYESFWIYLILKNVDKLKIDLNLMVLFKASMLLICCELINS